MTADNRPWIGVDLDATLAFYDKWRGPEHIGSPITTMRDRILTWIKEGKRVKIFTARATDPTQIPLVTQWLLNNGLPELEVTNIKDWKMVELWDDRAVGVVPNKGVPQCPALKFTGGCPKI